MRYIICYDISEQRIRARVAKLLEKRGRRLQYSVFTAEMTEAEARGLRLELLALTEKSEKRLLLIAPLCAACAARTWSIGEALEPEEKYIVA